MQLRRLECSRCNGMMVETYSDVATPDDAGRAVFGQRCVNCGEYVDGLVLQNRWTQRGASSHPLQLVKRHVPRSPSPLAARRSPAAA